MDTASLVGWLMAGVRGAENGTVTFYLPGTLTLATAYKDSACAASWPTGAITLDANGRVKAFTNRLLRAVVKDSGGTTIFDDVANGIEDNEVRINSTYFNGGLITTLDPVLEAASVGMGGSNLDYKVSGSVLATPMTWQTWAGQNVVNVKSFGAKGDGITLDTTAIKAALSFADVLGGHVLFPAGTYLVDDTLNVGDSLIVSGVGPGTQGAWTQASKVVGTHSTKTVIELSGALRDICVENLTGSGAAVALGDKATCYNVFAAGALCFLVYWAGGQSGPSLLGCKAYADGAGVGYSIAGTANLYGCSSDRRSVTATHTGMLFTGAASACVVNGFYVDNASYGIKWDAGCSGNGFAIRDSHLNATTPITIATATDIGILLSNNRDSNGDLDGYSVSVATGNSHTPDRQKGNHVRIRATTGAGTVTVNAPTPSPAAGSNATHLYIVYDNNAGGAVTWTHNAAFVLSAAVSTTDGNKTVIDWWWDGYSTKWREASRAVTA